MSQSYAKCIIKHLNRHHADGCVCAVTMHGHVPVHINHTCDEYYINAQARRSSNSRTYLRAHTNSYRQKTLKEFKLLQFQTTNIRYNAKDLFSIPMSCSVTITRMMYRNPQWYITINPPVAPELCVVEESALLIKFTYNNSILYSIQSASSAWKRGLYFIPSL